MVLKKQIMTKEGKPYITEDKKELFEYTLEVGDEFIPQSENIIIKEFKFKNYSIPVLLKGDKENIFIKLTPGQAEALRKKRDGYTDAKGVKHEPIQLTQHIFICYAYKFEGKDCVGIGLKKDKTPPKTFDDFKDE
jgi:hypothetical protein